MNYSSNDGTWQMFSDTDRMSAQILRKESDQKSAKCVCRAFSADQEERQMAIRVLKSEGKDACLTALPVLVSALRDEAESVRVVAAEALGLLEEFIPHEVLLCALDDVSWNVRAAAAQSLGNSQEKTPINYLVASLSQEHDWTVREAIVRALGKQGDFMPIPIIVRTLRTDTNWLVREAAAWALGELSEASPAQALIAALQSDPDESVRVAAAKSLGKVRTPEAEKALWGGLADRDEEVRDAVGWALQQFDEEIRGRSWGTAFNFDEPPWSRFRAPSAANHATMDSQTSQEEIFFALAQFMNDKKGCVRQADVMRTHQGQVLLMDCFYQTSAGASHETFLKSVNNTTVVKPIELALESRDDVVRMVASRALEAQKARSGNDVFIVSFAFSDASRRETEEKKPFRVVMSGVGCQCVREKDRCVLDQIVDAWTHQVKEPLVCEHPHSLTDLKIWYHPAPLNDTLQKRAAS